MKYLLCLIFAVRVMIPMGGTRMYNNVLSYRETANCYVLMLQDGKLVSVPIFWTIIEER